MSRDFFYQGNRVDYTRPDEPPRIYRQPVRPEEVRARVAAHEATRPDVSGAEILRRMRESARAESSIADLAAEFGPSLAYGLGMLTGDEDRAARWDAAVRESSAPMVDLVRSLPGTDITYSPLAIGANAVPFSDEIIGLAADALTDVDYQEAQQAAEESRALATATHTGSALVGGLGQAAITAPLALAAPATGATRAARVWSAARPAVIGGTVLGATGGALTGAMRGEDDVDESQRIERAARDAVLGGATGAAIGTGAGLLGAAGSALAANPSSLTGFLSRPAGAALTGAGYAVASAPDMSGASITDTGSTMRDASFNAPVGALIGGTLGTLAEGASAVPRARNYVQHLFDRIPSEELANRRMPPIPPSGGMPDETAALVADFEARANPNADAITGLADDAIAAAPPVSLDFQEAARRGAESARIDTGDPIENILRTSLRRPPAIARLQALGMSQRDIERASARYNNDPNRLVAAAREFGMLPRGVYTQEEALGAVDAVRELSGSGVRAVRGQIRNLETPISGDSIAREIDDLAAEQARLSGGAARANSRALSEVAEDFRYGPGIRATADPDTEEVIFPPERNIPPALILDEIAQYDRLLDPAYNRTDPTLSQEQMMSVRRVLADYRDRVAANEVNPASIGLPPETDMAVAYPTMNRAHQAAQSLTPRLRTGTNADARQAGMFRGWLESIAGGQLGSALGPVGYIGGRLAGFSGGRAVANYLPSVIAEINEGGLGAAARSASAVWPEGLRPLQRAITSPAVSPYLDRMTQGVERQLRVDPSAFGRLAGVLEGAARRGTLASVVYALESRGNDALRRVVGQQSAEDEAGIAADEAAAIERHRQEMLRSVGVGSDGTEAPAPDSIEAEEEAAIERHRQELIRSMSNR